MVRFSLLTLFNGSLNDSLCTITRCMKSLDFAWWAIVKGSVRCYVVRIVVYGEISLWWRGEALWLVWIEQQCMANEGLDSFNRWRFGTVVLTVFVCAYVTVTTEWTLAGKSSISLCARRRNILSLLHVPFPNIVFTLLFLTSGLCRWASVPMAVVGLLLSVTKGGNLISSSAVMIRNVDNETLHFYFWQW